VISDNPEKIDGCQFGRVSFSDGSTKQVVDKIYPANKEYLAIWDTIDCKIARYLGVSDSSMSAIGKMITANLLSSLLPITALLNKAGIFLSFLFMIFGCILIATAIRALHIFISSAFLIILLVYISPIIIPLCLFKKTEDIYNKWLKTLLGTAIQPIVLFAYLGIFISVLDSSVIGDGKFRGSGSIKVLDCDEYCTKDGNIYQKRTDGNWYTNGKIDVGIEKTDMECPIINGTLAQKIQPTNNSVACIIDFANKPNAFVDWPGLSFIGLFFKAMLLPADGRFSIELMTLAILRCIMILFVLSSFMDEIPGIGKTLLGGGLASTSGVGGVDIAKTMFKAASFATMVSNIAKSKGKDLSDNIKDKIKNNRK
jgi:type IV secretory pathway VirB6-like protein